MQIQAEPFEHRHAEAHRLVGQHGELHSGVVKIVERLADAGVQRGVVEHVFAVIVEEIPQGAGVPGFIQSGQSALHQGGRAVADV